MMLTKTDFFADEKTLFFHQIVSPTAEYFLVDNSKIVNSPKGNFFAESFLRKQSKVDMQIKVCTGYMNTQAKTREPGADFPAFQRSDPIPVELTQKEAKEKGANATAVKKLLADNKKEIEDAEEAATVVWRNNLSILITEVDRFQKEEKLDF